MNKLIFLGGPPRTAKTTILKRLMVEQGIQFIAADAIEHGWRGMLTGNPHQMLGKVEINGSAEYKSSFTKVGETKAFKVEGTESELSLRVLFGFIDYYRRNDESVAFEGSAFSPEWVKQLTVEGFNIKAAFVGYTDASHADNIIAYAKDHPYDWINDWLQKDGNEKGLRLWAARQAEKCIELKKSSESHGYPFFDISTMEYTDYLEEVTGYLVC